MKKYLRSILCLLLALCMVMCFAACDSKDKDDDEEEEEEETSVAGSYILDSMEVEGETLTAEDLADIGLTEETCFIILNKDGTGTFCLEGDVAEIEWDDKELTAEGESLEYTVKGNKLTIEIEGSTMTFKKTSKKLTVPEKEPEPVVTSVTYGIYAMTTEGVTLTQADLAAIGTTPDNTYLILNDDGTGKLAAAGEESDMGWDSYGIWPAEDTTDVADMTVEGDVVTISQDGFVMIFVKEGSNATPVLPTNDTSVAGRYELYSLSDGSATYEGATLLMIVQALEMDTLDEYMYLELFEDGTGLLVPMGIEGPIEYNETQLWPKDEPSNTIDYTYADGKLTFTLDGNTFVFQKK